MDALEDISEATLRRAHEKQMAACANASTTDIDAKVSDIFESYAEFDASFLKAELAKRGLVIVEASKHNSMELALRLIGSAASYAALAQTE